MIKLRRMKISNPFKSRFLRANATLGVPTLVRLFVGFAKSKTAALVIGPAGVGLLGIGNQLQSLCYSFTSLGTPSAFIRELSACHRQGDTSRKRDLLGTSFTLQCIVNLPVILAGLLLVKPLAHLIFGAGASGQLLIPILISIPIQSLMTAHLWGVFYAHGRLDYLARASVVAALAEAAAYVTLTRWFGVAGAFWGITLGLATWFTTLVWLARRLESTSNLFHFKLRRDLFKDLVSTGSVMMVTGAVTYLSNTLIRIKIMRGMGETSAGIYQAVIGLTYYYQPYFTNGVWGRLFPKVAADGISSESVFEWSEAIVLTSILAAEAQMGLMALGGPLVTLLYSRDFGSAADLMPIQLLGDLFYLVSVPCMGAILGLKRMRLYLVAWVSYYAGFLMLAVVLMGPLGLKGTVIAYLVSNFGLAVFSLAFFFVHARGTRRAGPAIASLCVAAAAVALQTTVCLHGAALPIKLLIPAAWGAVGLAVLFLPRAKKLLMIHAEAT
jgi:PST family polysaccharide transporter